MKPSLKARFWSFLLRATLKNQNTSIPERRAQTFSKIPGISRPSDEVQVDYFDIDAIHSAWIKPRQPRSHKVMLYLHGGGYVIGSIESYLMLCIPMAQTLGINILVPEYRLAPENPFPAALDDAVRAYEWLLQQGHTAKEILICGDSAGGGLSLATVLALRERGTELPDRVICLSPWTDLALKGNTHHTKQKSEVLLTTKVLHEWALCYAGPEDLENPFLSPINADLAGFPPLLIQVGSEEILLDDSIVLAEHAKAAGVQVECKTWPGMWHVWHALGNFIPESQEAFEEIRQFMG